MQHWLIHTAYFFAGVAFACVVVGTNLLLSAFDREVVEPRLGESGAVEARPADEPVPVDEVNAYRARQGTRGAGQVAS